MRTGVREAAEVARRRGWGVALALALLLALSTVGLVVAELLDAPLTVKIALSASLFAFTIALVVALVSADRRARLADAFARAAEDQGPPELLWLTPGVRAVLDQIDEAVHITDAEMRVCYLNPAFSRVSGYSKEDALGKNAVLLMRSGAHEDSFYEDLHARLSAGEVWSGHIRNRRASGEHFPAEETVSPIRGESGEVEGYVSIQRDLSETEEFERRMAQAKAIESFGLLAGGLAHDLNNFLIAIRTNVAFVQACIGEGAADDVDCRDALRESLEAIDRSGGLARKLLTMGKVHERTPAPVDPTQILAGLEATLHHAVGRGIVLSFALLPGGPRVLMEAVALEQIVMNLVLNARDALLAGGTIIVEGEPARRRVDGRGERLFYRLRVRDNGPGIPEEIRERVFDAWFTTKEGEGGTGLGLAVVRELVEIADGLVELACPPSGGTEISIYLPALELEDEKALLDLSLSERSETLEG